MSDEPQRSTTDDGTAWGGILDGVGHAVAGAAHE
jgi:hypothetical protein